MTNTQELRKLLDESGYKLRYIAECIGVSYQGFLNKINNVSEFKPSEINILCSMLGITDLEEKEHIFFAN